MSDHASSEGERELQFERLEPASGPAEPAVAGATRDSCHQPIATEYFHINGMTACASCREAVERALETPRGAPPFLKAGLFGFLAALVGAAIYATIIIVTNFELALAAIAIGYMVGWSVRKGARGGGRRFQFLAVALTYFAIALAYTPVVINQIRADRAQRAEQQKAVPQAPGAAGSTFSPSGAPATSPATSPEAAAPPPANTDAASREPVTFMSAVVGVGVLVLMIAALPVISIIGSLPSGVLSAIIIAVGMRQAWRMTGAVALEIMGPYRVATAPAAVAAAVGPDVTASGSVAGV